MKRALTIAGILCLLLILWYLFIKPYDYLVTFRAKTSPGTIHNGIREWGHTQGGITMKSVGSEQLKQQLQAGDSTLIFDWEMISRNDSVTRVKVRITDREHSLQNKMAVLFTRSTIETIAIKKITNFKEGLKKHLETFRVRVNGISQIPEAFCACIRIQTKRPEKTQGMKQNYLTIPGFLLANKIQPKGNPLVEVTDWDRKKGTIHFNFCFPIEKKGTLPEAPDIFYRTIPAQKALKATFYGEYGISDRAWFALTDYARRNNLPVKDAPVEIFFNNPNLGGNPRQWKAEVYMPVAEK